MPRLIDADVLLTAFPKGENEIFRTSAVRGTIDACPTVDAVPVVRCKDCKFSDWYTAMDGNRYCYCMEHGSSGHKGNDFCSYGEKEGEQE